MASDIEPTRIRIRRPALRPRVTVFDVARSAGVSIATVSKVLNSAGSFVPISPQTREKVTRAAKALNYQPDSTARGLRSRRTHTLGLIVANSRHPYFSEIIGGVEQAAHEAGYLALVAGAEDNPEREKFCIDLFQQRRVDGIVLAGETTSLRDDTVLALVDNHVPVVLVARQIADERVPQVFVDNVAGGRLATEHLLALGHRRIACLAGPAGKHDSEARIEGYRQALRARGLPFDPNLVLHGGIQADDGCRDAKTLLARTPRPTAIFCYNDTKAFGAFKAIQEAYLRVPANISVVGFDDIEFCDYASPPLTTVRQPRFDLGGRATRILLQLLKDPNADLQKCISLEPQLIIRKSTGPAISAGRGGPQWPPDPRKGQI